MFFLRILLIIILVFILLMQIRVGADISFENDTLIVTAKAFGLSVPVYPREKKSKESKHEPPDETAHRLKKKKKKKTDEYADEESKKIEGLPLNLSKDDVLALIKKAFQGVGRFGNGFHVKRFLLHYTAAGVNPADTAKLFGWVNAALSALAPICHEKFPCKNTSVWTDIDFTADFFKLDFAICVMFRIGAALDMFNTIVFGAIGIFICNKLRLLYEKLFDNEAYQAEQNRLNRINGLLESIQEITAEPEDNL